MSKGSLSASSSVASTESETILHKGTGFCKFFDPYKGYGYITLDEKDENHKHGDVFFYHTAIFMTGLRALLNLKGRYLRDMRHIQWGATPSKKKTCRLWRYFQSWQSA